MYMVEARRGVQILPAEKTSSRGRVMRIRINRPATKNGSRRDALGTLLLTPKWEIFG